MQIISWNVASVRARLPLLIELLNEKQPDIVFLQEIKSTFETFPFEAFSAIGYTVYIHGQKGFNGVAILSKTPLHQITHSFSGMETDEQARFIQAEDDQYIYISIYVPNGTAPANNPFDTTRLTYKLNWMAAFQAYLKKLIDSGKPIVLGGDFNVIATDKDVYNPALFQESALMVPPVRVQFQKLQELPLINTLRFFYPNDVIYSFWDFQMGAARRNLGILLDYIFISSTQKNQLKAAGVYKEYRYREKPSDHAPVFLYII